MSVSGHITGMTIDGNKVTTAYFNGQLVFQEVAEAFDSSYCVSFSSNQAFTLSKEKAWNGKLEWSNGGAWKEYTGGTAISAKYDSAMMAYALYLRGTGNTTLCSASVTPEFKVTGDGALTVFGNLQYLLDYTTVQNGSTPQMDPYCFYRLFADVTQLETFMSADWTESVVPNHGYQEMFAGCTRLRTPVSVNPSTVGEEGMRGMYKGCTALEYMQEPKFYNLYSIGKYGLAEMFKDSSLHDPMLFQVQNLMVQDYGLYAMYENCTQLCAAQESMTFYMLGAHACDSMYKGCTNISLVRAMDINIQYCTIGEWAFNECYSGCINMTNPGSISQNNCQASAYSFANMYAKCTSLSQLPQWTGVEATADYMCYQMFYQCYAMESIYTFTSLGSGVTTLNANTFKGMYDYTAAQIGTESSDTLYMSYKFTTVALSSPVTVNVAGWDIDANTEYYTNGMPSYAG